MKKKLIKNLIYSIIGMSFLTLNMNPIGIVAAILVAWLSISTIKGDFK